MILSTISNKEKHSNRFLLMMLLVNECNMKMSQAVVVSTNILNDLHLKENDFDFDDRYLEMKELKGFLEGFGFNFDIHKEDADVKVLRWHTQEGNVLVALMVKGKKVLDTTVPGTDQAQIEKTIGLFNTFASVVVSSLETAGVKTSLFTLD